MGQYWLVVNLDKKEFVHPHELGTGLKLWEQLANHPGTGSALIILCAAMPTARGGGDFDLEENWHGPERDWKTKHASCPGPMPESYPEIARQTIGRWAGDRIALVGDYAEDADLPQEFEASQIYNRCHPEGRCESNDDQEDALYRDLTGKYVHFIVEKPAEYTDISHLVAAVIEHELNGRFSGDGWRKWNIND